MKAIYFQPCVKPRIMEYGEKQSYEEQCHPKAGEAREAIGNSFYDIAVGAIEIDGKTVYHRCQPEAQRAQKRESAHERRALQTSGYATYDGRRAEGEPCAESEPHHPYRHAKHPGATFFSRPSALAGNKSHTQRPPSRMYAQTHTKRQHEQMPYERGRPRKAYYITQQPPHTFGTEQTLYALPTVNTPHPRHQRSHQRE